VLLRSVLQHLNDPFHRYDLTHRSLTHDEKKDMKETAEPGLLDVLITCWASQILHIWLNDVE
jgi:hypothetical protein